MRLLTWLAGGMMAWAATVDAQAPMTASAQTRTSPSSQRNVDRGRSEAALLLQAGDIADERSAVLDSALIDEVASALRTIRANVAGIPGALADGDPIHIQLRLDSATERHVRQISTVNSGSMEVRQPPHDQGVPHVGVPELDSLNRLLHANEAWYVHRDEYPITLYIRFRAYMYIPRVVMLYRGVPGVSAASDVRELVGSAGRPAAGLTRADTAGRSWQLHVDTWLGCFDFCEKRISTTVRYDRATRAVTLVARDTAAMRPVR